MPSAAEIPLRHEFGGGWATDLGVLADVGAEGGRIEFPFLLLAENVYYSLKGNPRKVGGTERYNSAAVAAGAPVRGMFEYVKIGTSGSPTRRRVVHAGTKVLYDENDGSFSDLFTGLQDEKVPNYNVFEDALIIASDSTVDVPKKWDQTTAANLGGSPPNFSFSVTHVNRLWAGGIPGDPSGLHYSALQDEELWNGAGDSGRIAIDPNDGDMITGIFPFRGVLLVFKGPNRGSIHVVSGRTPATFERDILVSGVGAAWQNLIFPFGNDVGFVSPDGQFRSVRATERFGNFEQGVLSLPIQSWIKENVNTRALKRGWVVTDHSAGYALAALPVQSSTVPNRVLLMDFRFGAIRWADWPSFSAHSVAYMSDPDSADRPILYLGGQDGFLRKTQQQSLSIDDSTPIRSRVRTPFVHYGAPHRLKTIEHIGIGTNVRVSSTVAISLRKSDSVIADVAVGLATGGFLLGPAEENEFVLDESTFGEDQYKTVWTDVYESGQFREISYEISNDEANEDMDVDALHVILESSTTPGYEN